MTARLRSALVLEREAELAELEEGLGGARAGRGAVYLVSGDPGIGKTTLVRAFAQRAAPTDVRVRWGRTWEDGGAPAYWPWTQILRAHVSETDDQALERQLGAGRAEVAAIVPELGITEHSTTSLDALGARFRLFEAVTEFLAAASADSPLLIILEDLHAADEASLSLLQFLSQHVERCSMLVVGTYRAAEVEASPSKLRVITGIERYAKRLLLTGLGPAAVSQLIAQAAGVEPAEELTREVHQTTEGNPFFVGEVARLLGGSVGARRRRLPIPEAVQTVVSRRLDGCAEEVRAMLAGAAVIGREFDLAPLARAEGRSVDELLDGLGAAARLRIVEEVGLSRWSFVHALIRETLYDSLPLSARVRRHRAVAEAFEDLRADAVAEIAHHRFEAARTGEDASRAVDACDAAGRQAAAVLAFEEAAQWYERALETLGDRGEPSRQRYELLAAIGEARLRGGSRVEGRASYQAAAEVARALGEPEFLAQAALGFFGIGEEDLDPEDDRRKVLLAEALELLPRGDSALRVRLLTSLCTWDVFQREVYEPKMREAVEMARRLGDRSTLAEVLWTWHFGHSVLRHRAERLRVADELVTLATEDGNKERLVLALQWRVHDRFEACDLNGMRADIRTATAEARAIRLPFPLWGITDFQVPVAQLEGRYEEAERLAGEAAELGRRATFPIAEMRHAQHLLTIRWQLGRLDEMAELAQECRRFPPHYGQFPTFRAMALAEMGRREEARRALDEMVATYRPM